MKELTLKRINFQNKRKRKKNNYRKRKTCDQAIELKTYKEAGILIPDSDHFILLFVSYNLKNIIKF
jgi:hypothetical protein